MGRRYADEILRPHVIPYAGVIGDSFVFQDDNDRPHRARLVENMLEAETIQRMEWPACSPDLNPIEHPDGHGYELVSSVRTLVPQKFSVEEELMHVKHVEVKSPHVGVMRKFGRGVISSGERNTEFHYAFKEGKDAQGNLTASCKRLISWFLLYKETELGRKIVPVRPLKF
ncbi:transposable element Tcb2 transposase [Trichonephila clavipes]|uniref:Transposable element Tcb2 transposase n=1 Tax=Trichonephila clavipes TaxID=2585209 RepID=A0A8X6R810_TRICX|nr:transposable element Tcb2 transposase [Trichonephila clavipes]